MSDWRDKAACRSVDAELFFALSDRSAVSGVLASLQVQAQVDQAKATCAQCLSADECLTWALAIGDSWAILGGTTPAERRAMARAMAGAS